MACPTSTSTRCTRELCGAARPGRPRRHAAKGVRCAAAATQHAEPKAGMDWDNLGFGIENVAQEMFSAEYSDAQGWVRHGMTPYAPIPMHPSAQVLNYGQAIFEGMKAQRTTDGNIVLFRPKDNAARMREGAARMSMAAPSEDLFVDGVVSAVRANAEFVPPAGKGSLYLRPLLLGTGAILGLGPASEYKFLVFGAAVGSYFKGGQMAPIDLLVETRFHRAAPGGMGGTKCAGNYSPVLLTQLEAKKEGFADVCYLDAKTNSNLEEVSSCNIFVVRGSIVSTPPLSGTILPGVTRRSVIRLLEDAGYEVVEEEVPVVDACKADEVFTTGTAVVVSSVGSLTYQGEKHSFVKGGEVGPVAKMVFDKLTGIQQQKIEDPYDWVFPV